jgi:hypothetical protein
VQPGTRVKEQQVGNNPLMGNCMASFGNLVLCTLLLAGASAAHAACEFPATVKVPDGRTASKEDMTAARGMVEQYLASMESYLACLDSESAAMALDQQTPEQKSLHTKRHNAAVDAMETVAADFNEQIRAFKAINQ